MHSPFSKPVSSIPEHARDAWALAFAQIAVRAGQAILAIEKTMAGAATKTDGSPVTEADHAAEAIILTELNTLAAWLPVVAEESHASGHRIAQSPCFALVDPLDGTKEFIRRSGEYSVNIALIDQHRPIAGAIYAPARDELWWGGTHAYYQAQASTQPHSTAAPPSSVRLKCRPAPERIEVVASRSHHSDRLDTFLKDYAVAACRYSGSSLKFCAIAAGQADLYPRFKPTMEWDTAAGHAILRASGGDLTHLDGEPFLYGAAQTTWENPPFVAFGDPKLRPNAARPQGETQSNQI